MDGDHQLLSTTETLNSSRVQLCASRGCVRDLAGTLNRANHAIASSYTRIRDSDEAMKEWWYRPERLTP